MPRDLFGDVTRSSVSIGNRKWYTVPVSLLSHTIVLATIVALPILAAPYMPQVLSGDDATYIIDILPPPPPPLAARTLDPKTPPVDRNLAPIVAPSTIARENPDLPDFTNERVLGVIGGSDDLDRVLAPPPPVIAAPPPQTPIRVGSTIRAPLKIRNVDPVYSPIAQAARIQGVVIIEATIGPDGRVVNARILRSLAMLDQSALEAVRQWEFTPSLLNGVAVPVIMTVTVNFTLNR